MKKYLLFLSVWIVSPFVSSGEYTGKFMPYWYHQSLYLKPVDVTVVNKPECATRGLLRLVESDISSAAFKHKYSMLLAMWVAGKEIRLLGTDQCDAAGDEIIYSVNYPL